MRWQDVDLGGEAGTVTINGTIVEPRKRPKFRQQYTKTIAGDGVIPVPRFCVDVLLRRIRSPDANTVDAAFWSLKGTYMQGSSIRRSMRAALLEVGIDPALRITPHAFRRTVATLLAREVSDGASAQLLGHADVSITHKHYIERLREVGAQPQ